MDLCESCPTFTLFGLPYSTIWNHTSVWLLDSNYGLVTFPRVIDPGTLEASYRQWNGITLTGVTNCAGVFVGGVLTCVTSNVTTQIKYVLRCISGKITLEIAFIECAHTSFCNGWMRNSTTADSLTLHYSLQDPTVNNRDCDHFDFTFNVPPLTTMIGGDPNLSGIYASGGTIRVSVDHP